MRTHRTRTPVDLSRMALYRLNSVEARDSYKVGRLTSGDTVCYDIALKPGRKPKEPHTLLGIGRRVTVIQWDA
ncbi:hypothetical protein [Acidihalobacter aeolianus]|nr:hypothetical protein [Acidihalobacter aeolianus]